MNKIKVWQIIGGIFLLSALILAIFSKEPFIDFIATSSKLSISGSPSSLFVIIGLSALIHAQSLDKRK